MRIPRQLDAYDPELHSTTWRLLEAMHGNLSNTMLVKYVHSVKKAQMIHGAGPLPSWSLFAGSGISSMFRRTWSRFMFKRYGIALQIEATAYAEHDEKKRHWIRNVIEGQAVLVKKVSDLKIIQVNDCDIGGAPRVLRQPCLVEAGVPCTSRTSLSSNASSNIDCCQRQIGDTGIGLKDTVDVVDVHGPDLAMLECVCGLCPVGGEENRQP